ncbi:MAG: hypothetical protein K0S65_2914 [Labilithrix sp.]|nr:hypothetical protein [Labilithrix sp.]
MIVHARWSRGAKAAATGFAFLVAGACGSDRAAVETRPEVFSEVDAGSCADRCSLDGRAVVKCSGQIEPCALELACGGGRCLEPCAAAAAEGSSNGCEFYFQPPLLKSSVVLLQSCYAAYVVNTSTIPVDVALTYEGTALDTSKSMYRTASGEATLVQHQGPIAPGDGVILFVSDRPLRADRPATENQMYVPCPAGVIPARIYDYYPKRPRQRRHHLSVRRRSDPDSYGDAALARLDVVEGEHPDQRVEPRDALSAGCPDHGIRR